MVREKAGKELLLAHIVGPFVHYFLSLHHFSEAVLHGFLSAGVVDAVQAVLSVDGVLVFLEPGEKQRQVSVHFLDCRGVVELYADGLQLSAVALCKAGQRFPFAADFQAVELFAIELVSVFAVAVNPAEVLLVAVVVCSDHFVDYERLSAAAVAPDSKNSSCLNPVDVLLSAQQDVKHIAAGADVLRGLFRFRFRCQSFLKFFAFHSFLKKNKRLPAI